jgi:endonuclease VIII
MPEGPEIKRAADRIAAAIIPYPVEEIWFAFEHLKHNEPLLKNQIVTALEPRGKALLIRFENGLNIYTHNQLYGKWVVRKAHSYPQTNRQLRLAIHNARRSALLYSASDIEVIEDSMLEQHPFLNRIGPDVLSDWITPTVIKQRLLDPAFQRRRFISLLLDQHFLAGLGNYLRSEIAFVAKVHPTCRPLDCSLEQIDALAEAAITIPVQSYKTGGITNSLTLVAQLKQQGYSRSQYRHWIFNREAEPCFVCASSIRKEMAGGRRYYYCPHCQPV